MKNNEAIERFEQAHEAKIDKLFWIAASIESQELVSFIEDLDDQSWKELFPELFDYEYFKEIQENGELIQMLCENDKLGFIAEVTIPVCTDFKYKDQNIVGYSSSPGRCRVKYVYAETSEELLITIEKVSEAVFEDFKKCDRKKKITTK